MKLPLRQDKSRKGGWECDLKPFAAIQRVDALPAKASQPAGSESCRDGGDIVLEA